MRKIDFSYFPKQFLIRRTLTEPMSIPKSFTQQGAKDTIIEFPLTRNYCSGDRRMFTTPLPTRWRHYMFYNWKFWYLYGIVRSFFFSYWLDESDYNNICYFVKCLKIHFLFNNSIFWAGKFTLVLSSAPLHFLIHRYNRE